MRKILLFFSITAVFFLAVYAAGFLSYAERGSTAANKLMTEILRAYPETGAINAVTAVYLDYRIYDTLFETFLLLISVMGLSQFLRLEHTEKKYLETYTADTYRPSHISSQTLRLVLPLFIIAGAALTAFGYNSPGGGFQGGSVFAAAVMVAYLSGQSIPGSFDFYSSLEEWLYIAFLLAVGGYFLWYERFPQQARVFFLTLCNFIISIKVAMGLIIVFLRMTGRSEHRTTGVFHE